MKQCATCRQTKAADDFHRKKENRDGLRSDCKVCALAKFHAYKEANRAKVLAGKRRWARENRARATATYRKWRAANPEGKASGYRQHYIRNYAKLAMKWTARRLWCAKATPCWADQEKIASIYRQAGRMREAGFDVHVDHIVPLRGPTVCGLHVHNNLRIIGARENLLKGNKVL